MLNEYPDVLTVRDVCQILKFSKDMLYDLIQTKQIPAYKFGKKEWRFNKQTLVKHLKAMEKAE